MTNWADTPNGAPGSGPYRIHVAAELSGVAAATLRAWERRYGVPVPRRSTSAYRLYTAADVEQVRRMRELVEGGVSPAEAARSLRDQPLLLAPEAPGEGPNDGVDAARERLVAAALRYDAAGIDTEVSRLAMLLDAQSFCERLVTPLLIEIGERWAAGTLGVAQEHLLSERLEYAMRATLRMLERPEGPLVLMACIQDEHHVLGMLGAALRLASNGARVVVLGAVTPPEALADAVRAMNPRLVGLSTCVVPPQGRRLMRAYAAACQGCNWVVGGPAAEKLRAAVEEAGGLVAAGPAGTWQTNVREWLRTPYRPAPTGKRRQGRSSR